MSWCNGGFQSPVSNQEVKTRETGSSHTDTVYIYVTESHLKVEAIYMEIYIFIQKIGNL